MGRRTLCASAATGRELFRIRLARRSRRGAGDLRVSAGGYVGLRPVDDVDIGRTAKIEGITVEDLLGMATRKKGDARQTETLPNDSNTGFCL